MAPCEGVENSTMETLRAAEFSGDNKKQHPSMPHEHQSRDRRRDYHESFAPNDNQGSKQQHELQNSRKRPMYGQQESRETFKNTKNSGHEQPRPDFTRDNGREVNDSQHYKEENCDKQGRNMQLQHRKELQSPIERSVEKQPPLLSHAPPRHMQGYPQQKSRWKNSSPSQNGVNGLLHQGRSMKESESQYAYGSRTMRPRNPWGNNRRNSVESGGHRPSNSSESYRNGTSRRDTNIPPRQSGSSFSDGENGSAVKKRVLNFQPGPGATQQEECKSNPEGASNSFASSVDSLDMRVVSLPSPRSGHVNNRISHPPAAPPLGSHLANQQGRSLSPACWGPPEPKRVRSSSPLPHPEASLLGQPNKLNDDTNTGSLSALSEHDSLAGRLVPESGAAENFDRLRAEKDEKDTVMALLKSNDLTSTPDVKGCSESATDEQTPEESNASAVLKLPASANIGDMVFNEIATDMATTELTEVTTETDLKTSASYSSCSLPHANTAPSAEITESPYSCLLVPEDETCACEHKNAATTNHIDVPVLEESSQRAIVGNDDRVKNDKPKEIVVTETVAEIKAGACLDVAEEASRAVSAKAKNDIAMAALQVPAASDMMQVDSSDSDSSDDETDDEELQAWAKKMFNIPPPIMVPVPPTISEAFHCSSDEESEDEMESWQEQSSPHLRLRLKMPPTKNSKKPRRRKKAVFSTRKKGKGSLKIKAAGRKKEEEEMLDSEEAKRKKEEAKPLTAAEVRKILAEDDMGCAATSSHWVRRSMRQPSRSVLHNPGVKSLVEKLRVNDQDMVVLKMKKYVSDSSTPCTVIDAALDALEDNTNCQALYIQNFNEGMRDKQVQHLLRILQMPANKIWCLNIGETYNVKTKTWKLFAEGLKRTKVTHMYASEHTISNELKDKIRDIIRSNRKKHDMHCDPSNLDVIMQCTHCWWNPFNAKALRPFIRQQERYEKILADAEAQGLPGSNSRPAGEDHKGKIE